MKKNIETLCDDFSIKLKEEYKVQPIVYLWEFDVKFDKYEIVDDVGSHTQITCEIVNIIADEDVLNTDGKISLELLDPIVYDDVLYDYFEVGKKKSDGFKPGLKLR